MPSATERPRRRRAPKPQPATREKTCQACGDTYTYPTKGSPANRYYCELCAELPARHRQILKRLHKRVAALEREIERLKQ